MQSSIWNRFIIIMLTSTLILLLSLIYGCSEIDDAAYYDAEFVQMHQMVMEIYHSKDVHAARMAMEVHENNLIMMEGNPRLYGVKTKNDFIFETRLRLWGIYRFLNDQNMADSYEDKIRETFGKGAYNSVSMKQLEELLYELEKRWRPEWMDTQSG